jgi:hypothetical protein
MGILADFDAGNKAEKIVMGVYEELGFTCAGTPSRKWSDWDIETTMPKDGIVFHTEVKYDIYANKSGNIAIETYNPKIEKESGLTATKADLWVHIVDTVNITTVKKLKEFVGNTEPKRIITAGGDDNATLYLYDRDVIFPAIFIELDSLSTKEREQTIRELLNGV